MPPVSEEVRQKISRALKGRKKPPRSPEHRKHLSEAHKGRRCPPNCGCGLHRRTDFKRCDPNCACGRHRPQTEEHRQKNSQANLGRTVSEETRRKLSEANAGRSKGQPATGYFTDRGGYIRLTMEDSHPLASRVGQVLESRKVLYDSIGPGPHECHWSCGRVLEWGGIGGIQADHVDGDKTNNSAENLVPSCVSCNVRRGNAGNPIDWSAS